MFGKKGHRQTGLVPARSEDEEELPQPPVKLRGKRGQVDMEVGVEVEVEVEVEGEKRFSGGAVRKADEGASCFSRLFFTWFFPILRQGTYGELEQKDLGEVAFADEPTHIRDRFNALWAAAKRNKQGKRSLFGVFLRIIGWGNLVLCFLLGIVRAALLTALPFVSKVLIDSFQEGSQLELQETLLYMFMLILFPLFATLCDAHLQFIGRRASTHLYEAFTLAIYNKSLRLTTAARTQSSTGQTVTMMSTDASTSLQRVVILLFPMMIAPFQITVVAYLLFSLMGPAMLAGIGILVGSLIPSAIVFVFIGKAQRNIMMVTDDRMKLVNEMISGIRIIKAYAWEAPFIQNLTDTRNREVKFIRKHAYLFSLGVNAFFLQVPFVIQIAALSAYYFLGGVMEPGIVFTALQLFSLFQQILIQFPNGVNQLVTTIVALRRIGTYLELDEIEIDVDDVVDLTDSKVSSETATLIHINNSSFSWGAVQESIEDGQGEAEAKAKAQDRATVLRDISLDVSRGERVAVFGAVGEGKTSLLLAILGELEKLTGEVHVVGAAAYAAQTPWIVNASIRDNILFGKEYDESRYRQVVLASSLLADIKQMPSGDSTMIGERGINLSGGQKARVSLARAVYADASIVMLDDPLAAVDAHVGKHIMDHCIMSDLLDDKAVLVVTNKVSTLRRFDRVLVIRGGSILADGHYDELLSEGVEFASMQKHSDAGKDKGAEKKVAFDDGGDYFEEAEARREQDVLYKDEDKQIGAVKFSVYVYYVAAIGFCLAAWAQLFNVTFLLAPLGAQYILSFWTNEVVCELALASNFSAPAACTAPLGEDIWYILYISTFLLGFCICAIASVLLAEARVVAVKRLHERLVDSVFAAPVSFYDTTPVGRVLNRFSKDINIIDTQLSVMITFATVIGMYILTSFVGIILGTRGLFLAVIVPVLWIYRKIFSLSRRGAIRLQRLEATTRSPIYSRFSELLNGLSTVRAYNQTKRFKVANEDALRENVLPYFYVRNALPPWLMVSLSLLGCVISAAVAVIIVGAQALDFLTAGEAGLALTFSLTLTQNMFQIVFVLTEVEVMMNAVERIKDYIENIPREESLDFPKGAVDGRKWPERGEIVFEGYSAGYRDGPDVLKELTFQIHDTEKIGIVGRTGSGKSTMILSLLRVINARQGRVVIDGVDIATLSLGVLRKAMGLIPQDPVCFIGTIRYNLDPFGEYPEEQLWTALEKVQLYDFVQSLPGKLEYMVQEGGENISVGQRQLLSIGRALLRDTRVLMLDEATANVDKDTDELLQATIRENFADRTVLTIAHRIETILDSTRVLVLDKGRLAEFDSPENLLKIPNGLFSGLVQASKRDPSDES